MESGSKAQRRGTNGEGDGDGEEAKMKQIAELTKETVSKIKSRGYKRSNENEVLICTFHDSTSPGYGWLLPGWVAQERHMTSGRVYRYYYDPNGRSYRTQREVIAAWEQDYFMAKLVSEFEPIGEDQQTFLSNSMQVP